jgi:predicted RNA-binding protein YlqC (UPF0109 family)
MKLLIEFVTKSLVDKPEEVVIQERMEGTMKILELRVAKDDYGKIIGKQGQTVKAMRTLLSAACNKNGLKYTLEVVE